MLPSQARSLKVEMRVALERLLDADRADRMHLNSLQAVQVPWQGHFLWVKECGTGM